MSEEINRYAALIDRLYTKTRSDELVWEVDPWSNRVTTSLSNYAVQLQGGEGPEGEPLEIVNVLNSGGETIDSFSDEELTGIPVEIEGFENYWHLLKRLRQIAMRKARGADKALDDIIKALDDDTPPF
jgi:hypothetical protein